jgi:hypothetical protein
MQIAEQSADQEFRPDVYCGRPIAMLNRSGRWHVYLDHVLQHNIAFATAEHALGWFTARIDLGVSGRRHQWRAEHGS